MPETLVTIDFLNVHLLAMQVITWKLEVEDGKCRPSGSPPRDTSLAAFADLRISGGGAGCEFPQHAEDCKCACQPPSLSISVNGRNIAAGSTFAT